MEPKTSHLFEMVMVAWTDSGANPGWRPLSDPIPDVADCYSVGWLIKVDKEVVVLAQSYNKEESADLLSIPMAVVKSITTLTLDN